MSRPTYFILVRGNGLDQACEKADEALELYHGVIHNWEVFLNVEGDTDNWRPPTNAADVGVEEFLNFIAILQSEINVKVEGEIGDIKEKTLKTVLSERKDDIFSLIEAIRMQAGEFTFGTYFYNVSEDSTRLSKRIENAICRNPSRYWLLPYDLRT